MPNLFDIIPNIVPKRRCLCRKIAGCFRSKNQMPTLKTDGQNCDVLLLGLRNDYHLHQNKFSACKSADDCKQFFCAFYGCFARIYRKHCSEQRISKMDFFACVLNKISCFSLFLSHSSPDDWKIHKALESKILQKHTPKYLKSLFLKIENIKVLWKTSAENHLKKYDFELNP